MTAFSAIEEGIEEIRQGRLLLVVDDEDRENEGDLVMAADRGRPEAVNFMAKHGRGLICVPLLGERLDELKISHDGSRQHGPDGHRVHGHRRRPRASPPAPPPTTARSRSARSVDPLMRADDLTRPGTSCRSGDARRVLRRPATPRPRSISPVWRLLPGRRHLRGARRGRRHGAVPQLDELATRTPQDDHDHGTSSSTASTRRSLVRRIATHEAADRLRRVHGDRLRHDASTAACRSPW
jgi:hypothetical protein